jgi:2-amino-4-hydroxy-6-hydroxymethyldihydropteridine diphosphokinase
MSLILATGSNLGNKEKNLEQARKRLSQLFNPLAFSRIYQSEAVDYVEQPHFLNQVLEFEKPNLAPEKLMEAILFLETEMGRKRFIKSGPRIIDIDIIFLGLEKVEKPNVIIPHPKLFERSFVLAPLQELPFFQKLRNHFSFPQNLPNNARPQ